MKFREKYAKLVIKEIPHFKFLKLNEGFFCSKIECEYLLDKIFDMEAYSYYFVVIKKVRNGKCQVQLLEIILK